MTAEWQLVDLTAGKRDHKVTVTPPPGDKTATVAFAEDGLERLRIGLMQAGLDARYFAWPPEDDPEPRTLSRPSSRSKPRTPASSLAAMARPSSASTCCAGSERPPHPGCSSSSAHRVPESRHSCGPGSFRDLRARASTFCRCR